MKHTFSSQLRGASRFWTASIAMVLHFFAALATAQTVTVLQRGVTKAIWVGAADYNLHNAKDYKSIVLASSLNAFYKTYPNATPEQAQNLISSVQNALSGVSVPDYVIGHQTQEDIVHMVFDLAGDVLSGPAKVSLTFAKGSYDALRKELNAQLDEQAKTAAENGIDVGFRLSSDAAYTQQVLGNLYDLAQADPSKAAIIDGKLGPQLGSPTSASVDSILQANPSFAQFQAVQYIQSHMLTDQQFQDGIDGLRSEFTGELADLNSKVSNQVMPLLQQMNQTQLTTYATLTAYIADQAERQREQQVAQQQQQANQLQLQASQSGVYLLSTFAGLLNPQLGHTLGVVGNAAIQVNKALTDFSVAASSVDTSSINGLFTGEQLGSVVLAGNLVGVAMQLTGLFQDNPSPDQIILDQVSQLHQQITQLQTVMLSRFDRIDSKLDSISGSIDTVLKQLGTVGADIKALQTQLFTLQSQVSRLEIEVHQWLSNSDRIPLQTGINYALGYQLRTGQALSCSPDFQNYETLFYTWATSISADTARAGPDYSSAIPMANQLNFPLSSNINYLSQAVSNFLGLSEIVPAGTRLVSPDDWLFSSSAYYRLVQENPTCVNQNPGSLGRIRDVSSVGKQLRTGLTGMANSNLFLDPNQGLAPFYVKKRDALKATIASYQHDTFVPAQTCPGVPDGNCIPFGIHLWYPPGQTTAYRPSISGLNACDHQHNYNLSVPGNDIYYAVPSVLLDGDNRVGGQIDKCIQPYYGTNDGNGCYELLVSIHIGYHGAQVLTMTTNPEEVCVGGEDAWYWINNEHDWYLGKQVFEDHSKITLNMPNWVVYLDSMLGNQRGQYYKSVVQQFSNGGLITQAATDLNVAQTLLTDFIELGMPQTLRGNDYLRSLVYGNQAVYLGNPVLNSARKPILHSVAAA